MLEDGVDVAALESSYSSLPPGLGLGPAKSLHPDPPAEGDGLATAGEGTSQSRMGS